MLISRTLESFMTVVEQGTIKEACASLNLTSSPISRRIKTLEDWVGFKLFVRNHNDLTLTQRGKELYEKISPLYEVIYDIQCDYVTSRQKKNVIKTLKIGMECHYDLEISEVINKLRKNNNIKHVFHLECDRKNSMDLIMSGDIDAIISHRFIKNETLYSKEIAKKKACFLIGTDKNITFPDKNSEVVFIIDQQDLDSEIVDNITNILYRKYKNSQILAVNDISKYIPMIINGEAIGVVKDINPSEFNDPIEKDILTTRHIDNSLEFTTYLYVPREKLHLINTTEF